MRASSIRYVNPNDSQESYYNFKYANRMNAMYEVVYDAKKFNRACTRKQQKTI